MKKCTKGDVFRASRRISLRHTSEASCCVPLKIIAYQMFKLLFIRSFILKNKPFGK